MEAVAAQVRLTDRASGYFGTDVDDCAQLPLGPHGARKRPMTWKKPQ